MTHELLKIFESYALAQKQGYKSVLATVVDLVGSSYRKPGVRMLIWENGYMTGAVSGGCVEKEVVRQSETVFNTGVSKIMIYDGRYRLGCEGTLYILIEPYKPSASHIASFYECLAKRNTFEIESLYTKSEGAMPGIGSEVKFSNELKFSFSGRNDNQSNGHDLPHLVFRQEMPPRFRLIIIGGEHDAVELCKLASLCGWEVIVVLSFSNPKTLVDFPGSKQVIAISAEEFSISIDAQTAIVIMTHNYARDLKYLVALNDTKPMYLGLLGAPHRKEKLMSQLLEFLPDADLAYLESIHGPAGLNIGAITPQEIAISIIAEIVSVQRMKEPMKASAKIDQIGS